MKDIVVCLFMSSKLDERLLQDVLKTLGCIIKTPTTLTNELWSISSIIILDEASANHLSKDILKIQSNDGYLFAPTVVLMSKSTNKLPYNQLGIDAIIQIPMMKNDLTLRLMMLLHLREQSDIKYRLIFENINVGIYRLSSENRITLANNGFAIILGYKSASDVLYKSLSELGIVALPRHKKNVEHVESIEQLSNYESIWKRADGSSINVLENDITFTSSTGVQHYYASTITDITTRKLAESTLKTTERRVSYMAYHDSLTDLCNRAKFDLVLNLAMLKAEKNQQHVALIYIDIDRFKSINDAYGHHVGDKVLREIADRLKKSSRMTDLIARVGGDEFVIILMNIPDIHDVIIPVINKIKTLISEPFSINKQKLTIKTSIGISVYPTDGVDASTLFKNADAAMYAAKKSGGDRFNFCTPLLSKRAKDKTLMEEQLRYALANNELHMHYQPKIDIKSGKVTGVEALLRWESPILGEVLPCDFIPLAEETGLITSITERVFTLVCQHITCWKNKKKPLIDIAVNLSGRSFIDSNFMTLITDILKKHTVDPHTITLEITESVLMQEIESNATILKQFTHLGLKISIDDFGTGYSSLNYLKYFTINSLKIDKSFVQDITTNPNDALIVDAIISMAHSLKFKVIAEGVETKEQYEFLKNHHCDEIQGFYFCKPLPPEDLIKFIEGKK